MPGARLTSFRLGDRTELLVQFCLNTIAFTTPVPRQEDVGHDLFCVLSEKRDGLIWAGPFFTIQARSSRSALVYEKPHEIAWVKELEDPFFLAIGCRDELRIDVYSTWARLRGFLWKAARRIVLQPGPPDPGRDSVWTAEDDSEQVIALGEPVIRATVGELMDEFRAGVLGQVLKQWVELDRQNIVANRAGMHWVVGPESYRTNELFGRDTRLVAQIFWNAKNLERCQVNFGRAATELRLTIEQALSAAGDRNADLAERARVLDAALRGYWRLLEPLSQEALRQHAPPFQRAALSTETT